MIVHSLKALLYPFFYQNKIKHLLVYIFQIYVSLQSLLGKPHIVGVNNLTWTLLKFINSESCSAESYSKLNVALSVMHECFEPLDNPFSNRDIVDDVVFNTRFGILTLKFMYIMIKRIIYILCFVIIITLANNKLM